MFSLMYLNVQYAKYCIAIVNKWVVYPVFIADKYEIQIYLMIWETILL